MQGQHRDAHLDDAAVALAEHDLEVGDVVCADRIERRVRLAHADAAAVGQHEARHVERFGRGFAWFDAGTHASLVDAATFVLVAGAALALRVRRDPSTIEEADIRASRVFDGGLDVDRKGITQ